MVPLTVQRHSRQSTESEQKPFAAIVAPERRETRDLTQSAVNSSSKFRAEPLAQERNALSIPQFMSVVCVFWPFSGYPGMLSWHCPVPGAASVRHSPECQGGQKTFYVPFPVPVPR